MTFSKAPKVSGPSGRARWARPNHIFIRHEGATRRDVYFRVNPQAIRVQQGSKGSAVDTLGGYFREVMYSEDPQHNGLLLPDLTIECDTGAGYRAELQKLEWIWKNHGTPKSDGAPADTYFMDMADEDTMFGDGPTIGKGSLGAKTLLGTNLFPQGTEINVPTRPGVEQTAFLSRIIKLPKGMKSPAAKTMGGSRFVPRCFKIEILNFSWDETVQDPYRIRFNMRCKILKDMFWQVDQGWGGAGTLFDLGAIPTGGLKTPGFNKADIIDQAFKRTSDFPLNPAGQVAMISRTLGFLPGNIGGRVQPILDQVLQATGLGQNQVMTTVQNQGQSVFNPTYGQRIYWRSEFSGKPQLAQVNTQIDSVLRFLPTSIREPVATVLNATGWQPPQIPQISPIVNLIGSLTNLRF